MRKLVLFDIDGTLVWTAGAGRAAIGGALIAEMGTMGPIDDYRFDGKTDPQIVVDLMRLARHRDAENAGRLQAVCGTYLALLADALESRRASMRIYPGVEALLAALEADPDVLLGLLTGNLERGAALKLDAAGVGFSRFRVGAYGSDHADRAELPAIAARRAEPIMGRRPHGAEIVIIGDTPADVTCGRGVRARAIGVATGRHSVEELGAVGAYRAFDTLADTEAVLGAILA